MSLQFDYIIIGSGFGGSVSALRLAEKGYKVAVLEQGKRYKTEDLPKTNGYAYSPFRLRHEIKKLLKKYKCPILINKANNSLKMIN